VVSAPYLAGWAYTNLPITIKWPQPPANGGGGTLTYDVIRQTVTNLGGGTAAPYGSGNTKVTTTVICTGGICSAVDNGQTTNNYTVVSPSTYAPALTFWPGSVILTEATDSGTTNGGEPRLYTDIIGPSTSINLGGLINSYGANAPTVFAQQCSGLSTWSSIWVSCPAGDSVSNNFPAIGALLLQTGVVSSGETGGCKGRLNLMAPYGVAGSVAATHLITLGDSNPAKTLATPGHRPLLTANGVTDVNDTWIGLDQGSSVAASLFQLAFGAPVSISNYIGAVGNPATDTPLERLTALVKSFAVPIASTVKQGTAPFQVASSTPVGTLTLSNHPLLQNCVSGQGTVNCQGTQTHNGQIVFGTIQLSNGTATLQNLGPAFSVGANCVANDTTNVANGVKAVPNLSQGTIVFTGTGSDFISYQCVGS